MRFPPLPSAGSASVQEIGEEQFFIPEIEGEEGEFDVLVHRPDGKAEFGMVYEDLVAGNVLE